METQETPTPAPRKPRSPLIIGGIVALLLLLAGAAFVGGRLFQVERQTKAEDDLQSAPRKLVTPAAGLPTTSPDARGDAIYRDGDSIFVCESEPVLTINPDGTINKNENCGLQVEVVVGPRTTIIHDVSALHNPAPLQKVQDYVIQQYTEPGSLEDISEGTAIRAWGNKSGSRIIASILLYWNRSPRP